MRKTPTAKQAQLEYFYSWFILLPIFEYWFRVSQLTAYIFSIEMRVLLISPGCSREHQNIVDAIQILFYFGAFFSDLFIFISVFSRFVFFCS